MPTTSDELSLDPANWERLRELGHRMLDEMIDYISTVRDRPAWRPVPPEVRGALREPLPIAGQGVDAAYRAFVEHVLPYPGGNLHPRFWGWVQGNGTAVGMLADMLASGLNPHMAGFHQAPALVEEQVLRWLVELMGFPSEASGVLVTGGTMANILGLATARCAKADFDVRDQGVQEGTSRLVFYGSTETHVWAVKAAELIGLGRRSFRRVAVDERYRIDVDALRLAIARDRRDGLRPFCVLGTAGTVNTGAVDDLEALAQLCEAEDLWFHVDGAFGALARLSPKTRGLVAGLERADSLAFDLHKWMYLPYAVACILVRDGKALPAAFAADARYLDYGDRGVIGGGLPFADRGIDLTRDFKALKVWMSLKAHGAEAFMRLIAQNVAQARYLTSQIESCPDLELLAPTELNVVCFRYTGGRSDDEALNTVNREILLQLQESGVAVPSGTQLRGRFALRVAIVNHRSRTEDFDILVGEVLRLGRTI